MNLCEGIRENIRKVLHKIIKLFFVFVLYCIIFFYFRRHLLLKAVLVIRVKARKGAFTTTITCSGTLGFVTATLLVSSYPHKS